MGCIQSSKQSLQNVKKSSMQRNNLDCSIEVIKQRYNPDFMKNGCQSSDLNDFSLCAVEQKRRGNFDDIVVECDEIYNNSFDEKKTTSSKSEQQQTASKQVLPAQMQVNWQLQNNICVSSLLQRRIISNKLKINSNSEINSHE